MDIIFFFIAIGTSVVFSFLSIERIRRGDKKGNRYLNSLPSISVVSLISIHNQMLKNILFPTLILLFCLLINYVQILKLKASWNGKHLSILLLFDIVFLTLILFISFKYWNQLLFNHN